MVGSRLGVVRGTAPIRTGRARRRGFWNFIFLKMVVYRYWDVEVKINERVA